MKAILKAILKITLGKCIVELAATWPLFSLIFLMRKINSIQLSTDEMRMLSILVKTKAPCKFLVFGLGNDSVFWKRLNHGGQTVFLEDDELWFEKIKGENPTLRAILVNYETCRLQWKELLESPDMLDLRLPPEITDELWDIVLVDAPKGLTDANPGRMKSIFAASKLVKVSGDVFVHDCNRHVEMVYCDRFLRKENLLKEVDMLRHYHF